MQNKEKIEVAIEFLQGMTFGGDYTEITKIKNFISLAVEALQNELLKVEVSE